VRLVHDAYDKWIFKLCFGIGIYGAAVFMLGFLIGRAVDG